MKGVMNGIECMNPIHEPLIHLPSFKVRGLQTTINSPVSHSARQQRPARERNKIRIASRENVDNQTPRNTNFTH